MDFRWPCPEMIGNRSCRIRRSELLPDKNAASSVGVNSEGDGSEGIDMASKVACHEEQDSKQERTGSEVETSGDSSYVEARKRHLQYLPSRSLLSMSGESRYEWTHAIAPRKFDKVNGEVIPRGRRISLTLRRVLFEGEICNCGVAFCVNTRPKIRRNDPAGNEVG